MESWSDDEESRYGVTVKELEGALKALEKRKACGLDGLVAEHLKYGD